MLQPQLHITATIRRQNKRAYVQSLGCTDIITVNEFLRTSAPEKTYSLIIDPVGGDIRRFSITALKPYGQLLAVGNVSNDYEATISSQQLWLEGKTVSGFNLALYASLYPDKVQSAMQFIANYLEHGQLTLKERVFSLGNVKEAHIYLQSGASIGRVLLEVGQTTD